MLVLNVIFKCAPGTREELRELVRAEGIDVASRNEEGNFKYVHDKGLEAIEFCVNHNYDADEFLSKAEAIKGYSEKYNVVVGSMGRWGMTRIDENGEIIPEALEADKKVITAASIIGCPVYNCGVNYTDSKSFYENCNIAIKYLGELIEFAKDKHKIKFRKFIWLFF